MMSTHNRWSTKQLVFFIGKQLLKVILIVAPAFLFMYYCEDSASAAVVGIADLIVIGAVIVIIMADDYDGRLKRLYHAGKL